jgi:DNA polymerase-3 subunit alpha
VLEEQVKPQLVLDTGAPIDERELLVWERELLGLYLSKHPLEAFETLLAERTTALKALKPEHDGIQVTIGGGIQDVREITTKNGQKMAFVKIADQQNEMELILFPSIYQQTTGIWERDRVIIAKGRASAKDRNGALTDEVKILVDDAREVTVEQARAYQATGKEPKQPKARKSKVAATKKTAERSASAKVYIRIQNSDDPSLLLGLKEKIDFHKGDTEVVLVLGDNAQKQIIKLPMRLAATDDTIAELTSVVGAGNVKLH